MSDKNRERWPSGIKHDLCELVAKMSANNIHFSLEIESERKLGNQSDFLFWEDDKLQFHSSILGLMSFDFEEHMSYHQRQNYSLSKEPMARALAIKGETKRIIWDATCGTGKDSLLIAHFGAKLKSFERHPAVFLLLQDAARRFSVNFSIEFGDASGCIVAESEKPDVIYYDPMYPEKKGSKKSALPRKEMRIFKEMVGEDSDSKAFLEWAMNTAKERVVVKRALSAEPIKANPTASYEGKSTRYDMYKIL